MAGMFGLMESITFVAASMLKFGEAVQIATELDPAYEFLFWFVGYAGILVFHLRGGSLFWNFMSMVAIVFSLVILTYLFGSASTMNFDRYAYKNSSTGFTDDGIDFFLELRLPAWFFVGIDLLTLTCEEVKEVWIVSKL